MSPETGQPAPLRNTAAALPRDPRTVTEQSLRDGNQTSDEVQEQVPGARRKFLLTGDFLHQPAGLDGIPAPGFRRWLRRLVRSGVATCRNPFPTASTEVFRRRSGPGLPRARREVLADAA